MNIETINLFIGICVGLFLGIIIGISAFEKGRKKNSINQPTIKSVCDHPFASVMSKCNGEINYCLKCGEYL